MISAFVFGLISSLHCIGMCGPIAIMLPVSRENRIEKGVQIVAYHLGRITSYCILGMIFGLFGKGLYLAGIQQQLSIVVGILMILFVLIPQNKLGQLNFLMPLYKLLNKLKRVLGNQFKKKGVFSLYLIGFFNGFLPCGMVYVALFAALATQDVVLAGVYMVLFGLGTIPLMSLMIYVKDLISDTFRAKILKTYPFVIMLIGMLFIMRGLGLDIPFVSPHNLQLFIQPEANC